MSQTIDFAIFAEVSVSLARKFVYLTITSDSAVNFISSDGSENSLYVCIRRGTLYLSATDADLVEHAETICAVSGGDRLDKDLLILCDQFLVSRLKRFQIISKKELLLEFDLDASYFRAAITALRYEVKNQVEDACENFLIEKIRATSEIRCSRCNTTMLKQTSPVLYNKLPKEDWKELLDCWSCHNNEFGGYGQREILYRDNEVYVGTSYVVFGSGLLSRESCACTDAGWVKVPIAPGRLLLDNNQAIDPLYLFVCSMFSSAKRDSSFKFTISSNAKFVHCWLLSCDSLVVLPTAQRRFERPEKALKVLWKISESKEAPEFDLVSGISENEFDHILRSLQKTNSLLPNSLQQAIQGYKVSFLTL